MGTRILSDDVIRIARYGSLNWHPGILPDYRGVHVELFALYNHDFSKVGYTIHYLDSGVDSGDIVWQAAVPVERDDDVYTLRAKSAMSTARVLPELFAEIEAGRSLRRPQTGPGRQYRMRDVVPEVQISVILQCLLRRYRLLGLPQPLAKQRPTHMSAST